MLDAEVTCRAPVILLTSGASSAWRGRRVICCTTCTLAAVALLTSRLPSHTSPDLNGARNCIDISDRANAAPASAHCCAGWPSALSHSCRTALQEAHRLASDHGDAVACVSLLWGCANQQLFCSACAIYWQTHFQRPVRVSDKQWRAARPCNTPCCRY